ncbi:MULTISPECIES: DUF2512 family protein [Bacillaceae]|uniref:YndM family protein n=1 Tax=Evansella alkalicola TaxID=745819 RepID=A0ABS6JTR7_9BACI|nr:MULTISPECIES: DUF2512 family protein [Bacillaceae]MBU9720642.1 YndM family protein [Bacillus alkalicola]
MNHIKVFAIKYSLVALVTLSVLTIFNVASATILWITLLVTVPAYIIGDFFLFPKFGNLIASAADFGLYTLGLWIALYFFAIPTVTSLQAALFATIFITFIEALFHEFVIGRKIKLKRVENQHTMRYQTEFGEDMDVNSSIKRTEYDNE